MKKIVLSLAGVMAAVAFAPEASALPVFARQTGMACSACHFNHAPLLNGFGRSFKSAGYSLMGAQGKVEGENLAIPDRVNMAILTTVGYEKVQNSQGQWILPANKGELSLFMGGRIMDNTGFLAELGMGAGQTVATTTAGTTTVNGNVNVAAVGAAKLLYLPEVIDGTHLGLVFDTNNGQGVAHGFEILNTGAVNVHKIAIGATHINAYSAAQWMGTANATSGVSLVAQNDKGFVNFSAYDVAPQSMGAGASGMPLHYARVAATMDVAGFDAGFGVQRWMGHTQAIQFGAVQAAMTAGIYDATVVDAQAQGEIAGMSTGIFASYGVAPKGSMFGQGAGQGQAAALAANTFKASSFNMGTDVNIGHELIARAAFRKATNGADNKSDNAFMFGVIYELAQNFEIHATHTNNFGDHWKGVGNNVTPTAGKATTSLLAEVLF